MVGARGPKQSLCDQLDSANNKMHFVQAAWNLLVKLQCTGAHFGGINVCADHLHACCDKHPLQVVHVSRSINFHSHCVKVLLLVAGF
jgi:hypothetical protein